MAWTEERIELLQKLWKEGLSASQIADKLGDGVTRNAVIGKAHRLGLSSRPSPVKGEAPAKPKPQKQKPAAKDEDESEERITLLNLTDRMCKWPIGHPGEEDFHFCGKRAQAGQPYCAHHSAMAYQTPQPRRDRRRG